VGQYEKTLTKTIRIAKKELFFAPDVTFRNAKILPGFLNLPKELQGIGCHFPNEITFTSRTTPTLGKSGKNSIQGCFVGENEVKTRL
jgi:hypothetical protein